MMAVTPTFTVMFGLPAMFWQHRNADLHIVAHGFSSLSVKIKRHASRPPPTLRQHTNCAVPFCKLRKGAHVRCKILRYEL
jgi:hypothetical protein